MSIVERRIPPLEAGDFLTREEFLRRWEAHADIKRAELLGGVVYMPSPVGVNHGDMEGDVGGWAFAYGVATPGCICSHNVTCNLDDDVPQPDIHLRILPEYGGASWVKGNYLFGPLEFIAEVCRSSASYDLHVKYEIYQTAGVREYLAILMYEKEIRWHILEQGRYVLLPSDADGIWRSRVFPGLWLDGQALLEGNMVRDMAVLNEGLTTPAHQTFVEKLAAKRGMNS